MFKKSRRKIVAAMLSMLILLVGGALVIIYGSSYYEVSQRNRDMLNVYVQMYSLEHLPGSEEHLAGENIKEQLPAYPNGNQDNKNTMPSFELSTFYSVAIGMDGQILATDNHRSSIYSNEQLVQFAEEIIEGKKFSGKKNSLIYTMEHREDYILVAFMNNTVVQESFTTLFRYTLLFGSVAIVLLFLLTLYWSKRIVEPLEKSYQKQKQFVSDAGHELKTPVSIISTNIEMLEKEIGENKWLANIQYENQRMATLVGQMLELARTERIENQIEVLDFARLVQEEILSFQEAAYEKGMTIHGDLVQTSQVRGNNLQLKQLVSILLDNAISHGEANTPIKVCLNQNRNEILLSVSNHGNAIPAEQRENIFERFYRLDEARNGEEGHYGLGLAIAKSIVEAHKGTIQVDCYDGVVVFLVYLLQ